MDRASHAAEEVLVLTKASGLNGRAVATRARHIAGGVLVPTKASGTGNRLLGGEESVVGGVGDA